MPELTYSLDGPVDQIRYEIDGFTIIINPRHQEMAAGASAAERQLKAWRLAQNERRFG